MKMLFVAEKYAYIWRDFDKLEIPSKLSSLH